MLLAGAPFYQGVWWMLALFDGALLLWALRSSPWRALERAGLVGVFCGACVATWLLWSLRTPAAAGFVWHLSGMVSLTLVFGMPLALVAGAIALLGVNIAGLHDWAGWVPTFAVAVWLPALLTQFLLSWARVRLPRHFMVYVFVNSFFAGGLSALSVALAAVGLLALGTDVSWAQLEATYLRYLPLLLFPEAMINGLLMVLLVVYKPAWVRSFNDQDYLIGK